MKKNARLLFSKLPVQRKNEFFQNLKKNWFFPISAMAFFCLNIDNDLGYCIGLMIVFAIMIFISGQISSVWNIIKQQTLTSKIFCVLSAIGICLGNQTYFYRETLKLIQEIDLPEKFSELFLIVSYFGAICAVFFVFFCLIIFWKEIARIFSETGVFDNINWKECVVYASLLMVSLGFMVFSFSKSEAFYGTDILYDIIYTSDSPSLVQRNVYMMLTHPENDIRQPLFAIFAAPFTGIPYLLARLFCASASVQAMLINGAQILVLLVANFMLTKMLNLDSVKRVCFMVLTSCTYAQLLFTLMMEQYIIAYFWLVFCMYLIVKKNKPDRIALWGAGGTLLTGMILLPFMSDKSPVKNFKVWLTEIVKCGFEFVAFLLVFCRFDVLFNLVTKVSFLSNFTGKAVAFSDKIYQYISFVSSCFIAPDAGVHTADGKHVSWQLNTITGIDFVGVSILALIIVSIILSHKQKNSCLAAGWVGFSAVMLLGFGWGTFENGLILYALYFGWAFLALLFQLVEKVEDKLNVRFLTPIATFCTSAVLLGINIPKFMEMLNFAIANYPV